MTSGKAYMFGMTSRSLTDNAVKLFIWEFIAYKGTFRQYKNDRKP